MRPFLLLAVVCVALGTSDPTVAKANERPEVLILATGGTIAGTAQAGVEYKAGVLDVKSLISAVPGLDATANVSGEQVAKIGSQDMSDEVWLRLAQRIYQARASNKYAGIVITHGTDTIEETAFFLDLLFPSGAPIVLTGSMRSSDAVSADGPQNLLDAVHLAVAANAANRGVMVTLNGRIHAARAVYKIHTENPNAFDSGASGEIGEVAVGQPVFFARMRRANVPDYDLRGASALPKVGIVLSHANIDPDLIDFFKSGKYQGVVLAGVGNGNTRAAVVTRLSEAAKQGMVVARSSRVPGGLVSRNVELNDDELGFVASLDLNPQKTRVLVQLVLLAKGSKSMQRAFSCETPLQTQFCR